MRRLLVWCGIFLSPEQSVALTDETHRHTHLGDCACTGINGESSFEAALLERAPGCEVWGYDFTVNSVRGIISKPS